MALCSENEFTGPKMFETIPLLKTILNSCWLYPIFIGKLRLLLLQGFQEQLRRRLLTATGANKVAYDKLSSFQQHQPRPLGVGRIQNVNLPVLDSIV